MDPLEGLHGESDPIVSDHQTSNNQTARTTTTTTTTTATTKLEDSSHHQQPPKSYESSSSNVSFSGYEDGNVNKTVGDNHRNTRRRYFFNDDDDDDDDGGGDGNDNSNNDNSSIINNINDSTDEELSKRSGDDDYSYGYVDNSQYLQEASAAAIKDAVAMKRSDSILTDLEDDTVAGNSYLDDHSSVGGGGGGGGVGGITGIQPAPLLDRYGSQMTARYMEEASIEPALLGPAYTRTKSGRQLTSPTHGLELRSSSRSIDSLSIREGDEERNEFDGGSSQGSHVQYMDEDIFQSCRSIDETTEKTEPGSQTSGPSEDTVLSRVSLSEGLQEQLESCGLEIRKDLFEKYPKDVVMLYSLFENFCTPPLEMDNVQGILLLERNQHPDGRVTLPTDVVIQTPSGGLLTILGPPLVHLPKDFASALFRILIRLLTNDSDSEYDTELLRSLPWQDDFYASPLRHEIQASRGRKRTTSSSSLKKQSSFSEKSFNRSSEARKADQLYSVVRLQRNWTSAVKRMLLLLESITAHGEDHHLVPPVTRFLGLLCVGSISVDELRRVLSLSSNKRVKPKPRLLLVRALRTAAAGASRSSVLIGKASPRNFFSFVKGPGMTRVVNLDKHNWPFKNDFGMALWFRAESFGESSTLLRSSNQTGSGIDIALTPLEEDSKDGGVAATLAISVLQDGKVTSRIKITRCILHARVWYHVALRHTRSRLKGVFSLSSREQISVMLDGKTMLSESLKFPNIVDSGNASLHINLGSNFDGQTGGLYVFHDNVSDATYRALYEMTSGTSAGVKRRASAHGEWDSRSGAIARKSSVIDLNMRREDVDDIVLSKRAGTRDLLTFSGVLDLEGDDEIFENGPLSKTAFTSKLYLVWDPSRTEGDVALEMHSGAHATMHRSCVSPWTIQGAQDVVSSLGGIQTLLPVFRSLLDGDIEKGWTGTVTVDRQLLVDRWILCSVVPALLLLLASFIRDHSENARELLRCGGIDIVEQLIQTNKKNGETNHRSPARSMVAAVATYPNLSSLLVESLLELRSASSHYVGLETKIFSRLLFNLPLWFGGFGRGASLYPALIPVLSSVTRKNPIKVRDCVGVKGMARLAMELIESEPEEDSEKEASGQRNSFHTKNSATFFELQNILDILLGMIFQVFSTGPTKEDLAHFLQLLSYYLETEWEKSTKDVAEGGEKPRTGTRQERYNFALKGCLTFFFLLQVRPSIPNFYETFADICGSVQAGAAWILSSIVNSYCDKIRSLGVRCIVCYVERTSKSPDLPLELDRSTTTSESDRSRTLESRSIQENAFSLISNVGQGLLNTNMAKNLASMGPSARSKQLSLTKLTARVVYKLMWHLLKSHRFRLGRWTNGSLLSMVFEETGKAYISLKSLMENFLTDDDVFQDSVKIDLEWSYQTLEKVNDGPFGTPKNSLGVSTMMRLLRFLPVEFADRWLFVLLSEATNSHAVTEALSNCSDWQPCLFQFISELVEKITGSAVSGALSSSETSSAEISQENGEDEAKSERTKAVLPKANALYLRLDRSLKLYTVLLGHRVRETPDKAIIAIEDAASLQRVCLNGQEVFCLILSNLVSNLSEMGVVSIQSSPKIDDDPNVEEANFHLKRSANMVTGGIVSNGAQGMNLPAAVSSWRCLRYITAVTVAMVTKLGLSVSDLFDYKNQPVLAVDGLSGGHHGIRLDEGPGIALDSRDLLAFYSVSMGSVSDSSTLSAETLRKDVNVFRRICVTLGDQILSLLDAFIFPDSLIVNQSKSQLPGLSLVRSTETRMGSAQGPLLASFIRLSLILLCYLEPSSVKLLQCSSRLRCFIHWVLELIAEREAQEGITPVFHNSTTPFDHLLLATIVQCHRTLGRCGVLMREIENSSHETHFSSKESQRKHYRRLLRVAAEIRDTMVAIYERRVDVLRVALAADAFQDLKSCLDMSLAPIPDEDASKVGHTKDLQVKAILSSDWVAKFTDVDSRGKLKIPELLKSTSSTTGQTFDSGVAVVEELFMSSNEVATTFEKSLNACFEKYLESQRQWAETGAVRDLEFEGDTSLKRLSAKHLSNEGVFSRLQVARMAAADVRWRGIDRHVVDLWKVCEYWKLAKSTDRHGRRILLVRNKRHIDHGGASYELVMGQTDQRKESIESEEQLRQKQELTDLMKRNTDAFIPYDENSDVNNDSFNVPEDMELQIDQDDNDDREEIFDAGQTESDGLNAIPQPSMDSSAGTEIPAINSDLNDDTDAWAKSFIWSDSESIVARFDSVMIVTLQSTVEGKILLTTHGLYFHQTGEETNVITKETMGKAENGSADVNDRRWRLSRLTEVHGRRYILRAQALELFFSDSHELFLNFLEGTKERNRFYAKLRNSCKVPMLFSPKSLNPRVTFKRSNVTELWRQRRISNFEYLMILNRMAGRTFNDIAQYPVFPWVLSDYASEKIDLSDSRAYRDLSKPVGALNPDRLAQLLERYKELEDFGFAENERFLYGSHYSSPGVILHYMIRQEPFTSMAVDLQSGRFDCPDRLFFDLAESWKSCNTSSSDVKELIPEFFTLPELFLNTNKFPLGKTQNGRVIDSVGLPPWAKGSAYEFVKIHRLALESEYVSRNLHHWVDLVFGYKQRGAEAEASHNVFHHLSYEGAVDLDKISDELDRIAAESHIQNFGQTPSQLLVKEPHPSRVSSEECWRPLIDNLSSAVKLRCSTPTKQFGGRKSGCGGVTLIHVQTDSVTVVYSDLKVGVFKWSPKSTGHRLKPDRLKVLPNRELSNSRAVMKRGSAAPQTMEDSGSRLAVGTWSFAITLGGYEKEQQRRKALTPSRLASAKEALYTDAAPLIVSCGYWDNSIKVHSTDSWKLECSEGGGHRGTIRCLAVGQDGGLLITGGQDCTCRVWVVDHPDMAIALSDGYVQTALGHLTDGQQTLSCCHVLWGHDAPITCVDLSSDLDLAVSGSVNGRICVHTLRKGEFIRSIRPQKPQDQYEQSSQGQGQQQEQEQQQYVGVSKLAVENHGRMVIHMDDGTLYTYTINGVRLCSADAGERINDMKITGEVLVTGGDRCHVYIRDLMTLKVLSGLDLSRHGPIRCISLTPDELNPFPQHMFIGSDDGMISIVDRDEES